MIYLFCKFVNNENTFINIIKGGDVGPNKCNNLIPKIILINNTYYKHKQITVKMHSLESFLSL